MNELKRLLGGTRYDYAIISVVKKIFDGTHFCVETINESVLVELMKLRGTPIDVDNYLRDTKVDFDRERKYQKSLKDGSDAEWNWNK